jgi:anti-sigma-K factor RskA
MSRPGPDHAHWADATGAYVLDALPEPERAQFENHMAHCRVCREEADELRVAAAVLPVSVPPVLPPAGLKARVMAEVDREAALLAAAVAPAGEPAPSPRRRWSWLSPRPVMALAAAAAVAVVVALSVGDRNGATTFPASMDRAQVARGAHGELRVRDRSATLVVSGLRPPQEGRVYQVWIKHPGRDAEPTDSLFAPRADGSATAGVPAALRDGDTVMVTSEPRGGSEAPTRAPLLSAALS